MMARMPATVTNVALRTAERGDGGAGSASSKPPVIDLVNNRLRFKFSVQIAKVADFRTATLAGMIICIC